MLADTEYRAWEKPVLYEEVCFVELSEQEKYVLDMIVLGISELKIMWLTGLDRARLRKITERLEEKLGTDDLTGAGALLRDHDRLNPISIGARMAERELRVLTGASIMTPIVAGEHCGLRLLLADGTMMNAWIYAHEEIDLPGHVVLQGDDEEIQDYEQISQFLADVHGVIGGPTRTPRLVRHLLSSLVERAIAIIDDIDGECTLEPDADDEDESDGWLNPVSLNPEYQREPIIVAVSVPARSDEESNEDEGEDDEEDDVAANVQEPFVYQEVPPSEAETPTPEDVLAPAPVGSQQIANPTYVIKGLPRGPRLPLARKMIADFASCATVLSENRSPEVEDRVVNLFSGRLKTLEAKSQNSPHHQKVFKVISQAYFGLFGFAARGHEQSCKNEPQEEKITPPLFLQTASHEAVGQSRRWGDRLPRPHQHSPGHAA
jgi:hypothetical protein